MLLGISKVLAIVVVGASPYRSTPSTGSCAKLALGKANPIASSTGGGIVCLLRVEDEED